MHKIKIAVVLGASILLSANLEAQRGNGRHNNHHNRYYSNRHYGYPNNRVTVRVIPRYNRVPVYRHDYRSVPVYRPTVRSVYRGPGLYGHFGPVFGLRINVLPFGYNRIYAGENPYYYNDGIYYRNYPGGGYEVVAPPLDARVNRLPAGARVTVIDGQKYYQAGGTFYQEEIAENNNRIYRVVGTDGVLNTGNEYANDEGNAIEGETPEPGDRYDELPVDSQVRIINQQKYFVSPEGVYYKEIIEGDKLRYEVTTVQ